MEKKNRTAKKEARLKYDFVGAGKKQNYFEGWYLKFQTAKDRTVAFIPSLHVKNGVLRGNLQWVISEGERILSGTRSFSAQEVNIETRPFVLTLGGNRFTERGVMINEEGCFFKAKFQSLLLYPKNIMGPFSVFQNLPCIHGLQAIKGRAKVTTKNPFFSEKCSGRVYCEKDRGTTFPERYIWFHADFPSEGASVFFSTALIPLGPFHFNGYIANIHADGKNHTFATYLPGRMKIRREEATGEIALSLENGTMKFRMKLLPGTTVSLDSPRNGEMEDQIEESMNTEVRMISFHKKKGEKKKYFTKRGTFEHCRRLTEKE